MLWAMGVVALFLRGWVIGMFLGSPPIDMYFQDTFFVVAHFHFVMASAALFGIFAGTYHWLPKMFGRMMNERLGRLHFWLTFIGIYATFFPMHFAGIAGMMRRIFSVTIYQHLQGLAGLNIFVSVAAFMLGLPQLIFIYNLFRSIFRGPRAERNPWQATTLEWEADSPPPHGNFGEQLPEVHRWPYDFSLPGAAQDFVPQTVPASAAVHGGSDEGEPS